MDTITALQSKSNQYSSPEVCVVAVNPERTILSGSEFDSKNNTENFKDGIEFEL